MRVWLIKIGEPLPYFHPDDRRFRMGIIARYLIDAGHDVLWWSSTFEHVRKRHDALGDQRVETGPHLSYYLLHGTEYGKNVSVQRILNHWQIGKRFRDLARNEAKPDLILCSFPTIELSDEATRYGRSHGVPVILDIRDLWPDAMLDVVPRAVANVGRIFLAPYYRKTRRACRNATALFGITPAFVKWGADCAGREVLSQDRYFPLANDPLEPSEGDAGKARRDWQARGTRGEDFTVCMVGNLGTRRLMDLETVISAARILGQDKPNMKFVVCGTGDSLDYYRRLAQDCSNVTFPGWVGGPEIWTLIRLSSVGLLPYASTFSFVRSYPSKVIEYLSGGLPIVSSLDGALAELLRRTNTGVTYPNGDVQALVNVLLDLAANRSRLEDMRRCALRTYATEFHPQRVYRSMIEHLELIASQWRSRAEKSR